METAYKNIGYLFVAILGLALLGFYKSYFGLFPDFQDITRVHHFHGLLMSLWLLMLITQPFLIRYDKVALHKIIGKVSYALVPLLLFSIFLMARMAYYRDASVLSPEENIGALSMSLPDIAGFATLYILAIANRKNTPYHMRYMIGTSLLLISPALGRVLLHYTEMSFVPALVISQVAAVLVALFLIVFDAKKGKPYKPYVITLLIYIAMHLCVQFQMSFWWQAFAGKFAELFL